MSARGVPAAGDDAAVDALFRRFFVGVIGKRHVAFAEIEHFLLVDANRSELVHGAGDIIFEKAVVSGNYGDMVVLMDTF